MPATSVTALPVKVTTVAIKPEPVKEPPVVVIKNDEGGIIDNYNMRFDSLERSGLKVIIDGYCMSACTRFMKLRNVCVRANAYFYFHAASVDDVVLPQVSRQDSLRTDLPEAFRLQEKYNVFRYGLVQRRPAAKVYLEKDVERVYQSIWDDAPKRGPFQVWLKVKATKFVKPC